MTPQCMYKFTLTKKINIYSFSFSSLQYINPRPMNHFIHGVLSDMICTNAVIVIAILCTLSSYLP